MPSQTSFVFPKNSKGTVPFDIKRYIATRQYLKPLILRDYENTDSKKTFPAPINTQERSRWLMNDLRG